MHTETAYRHPRALPASGVTAATAVPHAPVPRAAAAVGPCPRCILGSFATPPPEAPARLEGIARSFALHMPLSPHAFQTGGALQGAVAASLVHAREAAAELAPGARVGTFRVVRELGRGG